MGKVLGFEMPWHPDVKARCPNADAVNVVSVLPPLPYPQGKIWNRVKSVSVTGIDET